MNLNRASGRSSFAIAGAIVIAIATTAALFGVAKAADKDAAPTDEQRRVAAENPLAAGEYLVRICGCNDCHTPGYTQTGGKVPKMLWLTGVPVGFRGPWGTSYASNLRLYVDPLSEDDWVRVTRARNDKPPMPWQSLHAMSDPDLRAIYKFIKSLGKAGMQTPQDAPPGQEPKTPFAIIAPPTMPGALTGK